MDIAGSMSSAAEEQKFSERRRDFEGQRELTLGSRFDVVTDQNGISQS